MKQHKDWTPPLQDATEAELLEAIYTVIDRGHTTGFMTYLSLRPLALSNIRDEIKRELKRYGLRYNFKPIRSREKIMELAKEGKLILVEDKKGKYDITYYVLRVGDTVKDWRERMRDNILKWITLHGEEKDADIYDLVDARKKQLRYERKKELKKIYLCGPKIEGRTCYSCLEVTCRNNLNKGNGIKPTTEEDWDHVYDNLPDYALKIIEDFKRKGK